MSPRRPHRPPTLREAQHADVERGWGQVEDQLLPWDTKLVHKAKRWTRVIAAITGLVTIAGSAVVTAKGYATKLWRVVHRGTLAPAAPPVHNPDLASTAVDRVPEPKPPRP